MKQTDNNPNAPTSLFLTIDDADRVVDAAVKETSYHNSYRYLLHELDRTDWEQIPNHTVVEYRFPDRNAVPPLDPGVKNEYYSRDFYYAVDGMDIPRQYIPLPVAYYLSWNNLEMFQPEDVYRQIERCRDYREFAYMNDRSLYRYPERKNKEDVEALAAIRTSGGPVVSGLRLAQNYWDDWVANGNPKVSSKTGNTLDIKKQPYIPKRNVKPPNKPVKKRGIGF
jgi:hypothetical protein